MLNFNHDHVGADLSQVKPKMTKAKTAGTVLLAGAVLSSVLLLSGCGNYNVMDTKYTFNKAIIFSETCATIIEVDKWADYDGEQLQIQTKDGAIILTSSFDTKLIDDRNSEISAEDIIRSIKGENFPITYLDDAATKDKTK